MQNEINSSLLSLHRDILLLILGDKSFNPQDIINISLTCNILYKLNNSPTLWHLRLSFLISKESIASLGVKNEHNDLTKEYREEYFKFHQITQKTMLALDQKEQSHLQLLYKTSLRTMRHTQSLGGTPWEILSSKDKEEYMKVVEILHNQRLLEHTLEKKIIKTPVFKKGIWFEIKHVKVIELPNENNPKP